MTHPIPASGPMLTTEEIRAAVSQRLDRYARLNLFEQFALFMGTAQILELALKSVLQQKYGLELERMERWTLGRTARELRDQGCRTDFCQLLDSVVEYRNHIAHELLAAQALLKSLLDGADTGRLATKHLDLAIYELEQLVVLYDWQLLHDAW
jgi:hypothetical protein